jgi:PAS domain S-box-containing protein
MGLDYRSVLDGFADAVVAADERGEIVFANPAAERLLGWDGGGLVGQPLVAIQPERLRDAHRSGFRRYLETRVPQLLGRPVRVPALRRDGSEVDVELAISAHPLDGRGELFVAALRDLGDRVELERQLVVGRYLKATNEAAARLTAHLDAHHIVTTAVDVLVADLDAALARIWLHRADEGILELVASAGLSTATTTSGRARLDLATYPYKVGEVARSRRPFVRNGLEGDPHFEQDWVEREGIAAAALYPLVVADELLGVLAYFTRQPLHEEVAGALAAFAAVLGTALDDARQLAAARTAQAATDEALAQARRANQALARSNADLEQFATVASHDLREPLRAVAGYAQLLRKRYGGRLDEDADEFMAFMVDGAKRLQALTDALLDYSRVDNEPLRRVPVDLAKLAAQVLELLAAPIGERDARVDVGPLPTIEGEEAQLLRVLQNLVANAVKFTETGRTPQVEVTARHDPGGWRISVADRGIGIDPARADQVFQMFKRLHSRHDYPGSGIGLSLCRRIVERHGGRIWFEPREGDGTVFHFTVPE